MRSEYCLTDMTVHRATTVLVYIIMCLFFFSSRRRHTRWPRDWSSDVCSSDLTVPITATGSGGGDRHGVLDRVAAHVGLPRSEERRVGKSVELGGSRIIKKKRKKGREREVRKRRSKKESSNKKDKPSGRQRHDV